MSALRAWLVVTWLGLLALPGAASAADLLEQDWVLNPELSNVYMQTVKKNALFETHQFTSVEGTVGKDGTASVKIDLATLDTGLDIRDVRMRFLLFETFKFPFAEITAKLDKAKLQELKSRARVLYPLELSVGMHGVVSKIVAPVWITRIDKSTVSVATVAPIIVTAASFGLEKNIAKLVEVLGGTLIAPAASITFDLVFGSGDSTPKLESARAARAKKKLELAAKALTSEACENRFTAMSQTGAIYFKTGSAELDAASAPLLDAGADIAIRCPGVRLAVEGHTDNVGGKASNQPLSERRAKAVVDYLTTKGVKAASIASAGFGDTKPVAANDNEEGRAKNRRIEFKVGKQ